MAVLATLVHLGEGPQVAGGGCLSRFYYNGECTGKVDLSNSRVHGSVDVLRALPSFSMAEAHPYSLLSTFTFSKCAAFGGTRQDDDSPGCLAAGLAPVAVSLIRSFSPTCLLTLEMFWGGRTQRMSWGEMSARAAWAAWLRGRRARASAGPVVLAPGPAATASVIEPGRRLSYNARKAPRARLHCHAWWARVAALAHRPPLSADTRLRRGLSVAQATTSSV